MTWAHDWIDWPDFLLPRDSEQAMALIRGLHAKAKAGLAVEVACGGGVGRTGTVIAVLAVLSGKTPVEALAWTRANYNHRAVETPWQRKWIARSTAS
jgi:protein-tyrosine phosphatase